MPRRRKPPSQSWRTFLKNHLGSTVAVDFFAVPTLTCRILFVFVVLAHDRRRILHVNVTRHPTSAWTRQQLREAFSERRHRAIPPPRRRRDLRCGVRPHRRSVRPDVRPHGTSSPWQNPYVERVIGSIRRECLDHVIVFNERHLRRVLRSYVAYYHALPNAPRARQGHARGARHRAGRRRSDRGAARSRRAPPSLRTASRLIGAHFTPGVRRETGRSCTWRFPRGRRRNALDRSVSRTDTRSG